MSDRAAATGADHSQGAGMKRAGMPHVTYDSLAGHGGFWGGPLSRFRDSASPGRGITTGGVTISAWHGGQCSSAQPQSAAGLTDRAARRGAAAVRVVCISIGRGTRSPGRASVDIEAPPSVPLVFSQRVVGLTVVR